MGCFVSPFPKVPHHLTRIEMMDETWSPNGKFHVVDSYARIPLNYDAHDWTQMNEMKLSNPRWYFQRVS